LVCATIYYLILGGNCINNFIWNALVCDFLGHLTSHEILIVPEFHKFGLLQTDGASKLVKVVLAVEINENRIFVELHIFLLHSFKFVVKLFFLCVVKLDESEYQLSLLLFLYIFKWFLANL
jgi:hypothetical protein